MAANPIERLFAALEKGDVQAARDCFTPDAIIWHGFDGIALDLDTAVQGWEQLIKYTTERRIDDIRLQQIPDGLVQQHMFTVRSAGGERKAWPICVIVKISGDRISRFDEYMDRAGSFAPGEGPITTPGFWTKDNILADKLNDRRILITGAASGMGRAIAELFAAEGAKLALLDRNAEGVAAIAATLGGENGGHHGYGCDVSARAEVNDVVAQAGAALGGIDGLINAAGILDITPLAQLDPASWDRMIAVNLTGPFNIVQAALPLLSQAARATIVNIASVSGLMPMPGTTGYSASKAGLVMFTKCLGMDLGPAIRANTICPGVIQTEMTRYLWENPEHTARAALFFSTEDSGFTTGAALPVDGGFSWR